MYDVAVVGGGTMGSAAAYHLARRGVRVVVFEQFGIVHDYGSHSGETRVIRHAYHESPAYVPLVLRADTLWCQLEDQTGVQLLVRTGGIVLGPAGGRAVTGAVEACLQHNLPFEKLSAAEVMRRWPQFRPDEDWQACYDPQMGFLLVHGCISTHLQAAEHSGAKVITGARVTQYLRRRDEIEIRTTDETYSVKQMVVCAGSWSAKILSELTLPLSVKRRTLAWFRVFDAFQFESPRFPIFLAETPSGLIYGFPLHQHSGIKIANHHASGEVTDADTANRVFSAEDVKDVQAFIRAHLNGVDIELIEGKVCLYTLTPDEHFIVDFHPLQPNILIAAGFSGHGFKFAPVIGEILADLCTEGRTAHPVEIFNITRFRV